MTRLSVSPDGTTACVCGWDVEYALLCTAQPGVLQPTGNVIVLCPPERGCTDAVAHRAADTNWHTARGGAVTDWYARHDGTTRRVTPN